MWRVYGLRELTHPEVPGFMHDDLDSPSSRSSVLISLSVPSGARGGHCWVQAYIQLV